MTQSEVEAFDVRSLAITLRDGHRLPMHHHPWAQLVYARSGLMHVRAGGRIWFVPPTRAIWVPPDVNHEIVVKGEVAMRTLYISHSRAAGIKQSVEAIEVAPPLGELILHILTVGMLDAARPDHARLAGVLMDLIAAARAMDLVLPMPTDERALTLAERIRSEPADKRDLEELARETGGSLRTLQRCFSEQTGFTIETWRQKARLAHSAAALAAGASVTQAALDCGYDSPSAYIAAFRKHFGLTPGKFRTPEPRPSHAQSPARARG